MSITRNYFQEKKNEIEAAYKQFEIYTASAKEALKAIDNNKMLSDYAKDEQKKEVQSELNNYRDEFAGKVNNIFSEIEKRISGNGTPADATVKSNIIATIVAMGDSATPDVIAELVEPLKHDISALKQLERIFDKLHMGDIAKESKIFDYWIAQNNFDAAIKEAKEVALIAFNNFNNSLSYTISKNMMMSKLNYAADQLDTLFLS